VVQLLRSRIRTLVLEFYGDPFFTPPLLYADLLNTTQVTLTGACLRHCHRRRMGN
jgi:hypothetical protein